MAKLLKSTELDRETVHLNNFFSSPPSLPVHEAPHIPDLQDVKNTAWQAGFDAGINEGKTQGFQEEEHLLLKNMAEDCARLHELLQTIPHAVAHNRQQLAPEIADIVLMIVQKLLINQEQCPDTLMQQIQQIISLLNSKHQIELFVHPKDLTLLQQNRLPQQLAHCRDLRIIADETLQLGGCRIKSNHGFFDASIEHQINNLKQILLEIKQGMRL